LTDNVANLRDFFFKFGLMEIFVNGEICRLENFVCL